MVTSAQFYKMYSVIVTKEESPDNSAPIVNDTKWHRSDDRWLHSILGACPSRMGVSACSAAVQLEPHKQYQSVWEPKSPPLSDTMIANHVPLE